MITWFLKRKLKRLSERSAPSSAFVGSLACVLRERGYLSSVRQPLRKFLSTFRTVGVMVGVTVLCFSFAGTAAYAYASDGLLPDHPLYPLRMAVERVEYAVVPPSDRPNVELKQARRRLQELKRIERARPTLILEQEKRIEKKIKRVAEKAKQERTSSAWVKAEAEDLEEVVEQARERWSMGDRQTSAEAIERQMDLLEEGLREEE
jgi:hypothetical protein